MARHPEWFERLDSILAALGEAPPIWLGRKEIQALFGVSERASIRLLHQFGAAEIENALTLSGSALAVQLRAIRAGSSYAAFLGRRQQIAQQLGAARVENAARQFRVRPLPAEEHRPRLEDLPASITWRRRSEPGQFTIVYDDGADLMWQLAEFLAAAGANREEFFEGTEPADDAAR